MRKYPVSRIDRYPGIRVHPHDEAFSITDEVGTKWGQQRSGTRKGPTAFAVRPCTFWLPGTDLNRQPSD